MEKELKLLKAEIDLLRAKNDLLLIAVKHLLLANPNGAEALKSIIHSSKHIESESLFSEIMSDEYRSGIAMTIERMNGWTQPKF